MPAGPSYAAFNPPFTQHRPTPPLPHALPQLLATLLPGDLVLTGSPAGNGLAHGRLLRPGDVMESAIAGLGAQVNHCVAEA